MNVAQIHAATIAEKPYNSAISPDKISGAND
jgi:hypothetical protein